MRKSRFTQTEPDRVSRPERLGNSNLTVLMAWSFWDASVSDTRGGRRGSADYRNARGQSLSFESQSFPPRAIRLTVE